MLEIQMPNGSRSQGSCPVATSSCRWIVAQEGSRRSYAVPVSLHRINVLRLFYADIWLRRGRSCLARGTKAARALASRHHSDIPAERVVSFDIDALRARALDHLQRTHLTPAKLADRFCRFGRWFAQRVRSHLETIELDAA